MTVDYRGSHTPADIRDLWQTPRWLFDYMDNLNQYVCDIAASDYNHLCNEYVTEQQNAFIFDFSIFEGNSVWCNPPYSDINPWVDLAIKNRNQFGVGTTLLVPADTSVKWFEKALNSCDKVYFIVGGRISFIRADNQQAVSGNTKGSVLFHWEPITLPKQEIYFINRDDIKQ